MPKLPSQLQSLNYCFFGCEGITEVDFSTLPTTLKDFNGAFSGTSITTANVVLTNTTETSCYDFAYVFSDCPYLTSVTVDATNQNPSATLWLQGICNECEMLDSFELKNIPANAENYGAYASSNMFTECINLTSVKNEGYFMLTVDESFENCGLLLSIETKGFKNLYSKDCLEDTFKGCSALTGVQYISFGDNSDIYDYTNDFTPIKKELGETFKDCGDTTFYVGCQPLVNYLNNLKTTDTLNTEAIFEYWKEGDNTPINTVAPSRKPAANTMVQTTPKPTKPAVTSTSRNKKSISLKLKSYKAKAKKITGVTVKRAKVTVKVGKKTYQVKSNAKGKFTVKLKAKLKKKDAIKVTVKKSGYTTKTKSYKVK